MPLHRTGTRTVGNAIPHSDGHEQVFGPRLLTKPPMRDNAVPRAGRTVVAQHDACQETFRTGTYDNLSRNAENRSFPSRSGVQNPVLRAIVRAYPILPEKYSRLRVT